MTSVDSFPYNRFASASSQVRLAFLARDPVASSDAFQTKLSVLTFAVPAHNKPVTANEREFIVP